MKINLVQQETGDRRQEAEEHVYSSYPSFNWIKQINLLMEKVRKIFIPCLKTQKLLTGLLLSIFLCFSTSFTSSSALAAAPSQIAENADASHQSDRLPPKIAKAVIADLTKQQNIPPAKLKVTKYSRESWPDGCLGLPQPEEICSQAIVEGWRVVVSDGSQKWIYRTDNSGRNVRLEAPKVSNIKI